MILKTEDPAGNESDDGSNDFLDEQNQEHFNIEDVPESIDGIIRYMDEQDPGNSYYERQQDNRGGKRDVSMNVIARFVKDIFKLPTISMYTQDVPRLARSFETMHVRILRILRLCIG